MKRVVLIIFLVTNIYSQEDTTKVETNQLEIKSQDLSISVLWTLFGFTHVKYSKNFDNGKKEYGFMLGTFGYDEDYKDFPCRCGSKNCVGFIVREGSRWRIKRRK